MQNINDCKLVGKTKKITIQDVARHANVSVGTIDRVIHNRGKVSPAKREKVEEAIKELNFNPNLLARTLALGNRFTICALIPSTPYPGHYWSIPTQGIDVAAAQFNDYGIVVEYYYYDLFDETSFVKQAGNILNASPHGVIMAPLFLQESKTFTEKLKKKKIPYIFIDADLPGGNSLSYIGPDVKRSAFIAGKLLNSVLPENSEILIVNMVKGFENAAALRRIEDGFREYFQNKGLEKERPIQVLTISSTHKETVFRELTKFYIRNSSVKGVFVTNSKSFLVSEYHRQHELDIRVVGYDLVEDNAHHLKTGGIDFIISQGPFQQGKRAIQTLFDYFVFKKEPEKIQHVPLDIIIYENLDFYISFNRLFMNETKDTIT
ncbi:LacI family DNA-binding transcriptional regulator [Mariniphaga sediminis]|uniref:LacI family DNA-binding transcriptional regulator n=1 Tax=Mariniphaga sediminis TaxID=1628158 RepID=A0A399D3T8_9BACT|nr:LacI family DNA-binding transcriptional regulator [Mariniphaga sediminis]